MKVYMMRSVFGPQGSEWPVSEPQLRLLVISAMGREMVGEPVPGKGVQVTDFRSSVIAMMPSFFLKTALPLAVAILVRWC